MIKKNHKRIKKIKKVVKLFKIINKKYIKINRGLIWGCRKGGRIKKKIGFIIGGRYRSD